MWAKQKDNIKRILDIVIKVQYNIVQIGKWKDEKNGAEKQNSDCRRRYGY